MYSRTDQKGVLETLTMIKPKKRLTRPATQTQVALAVATVQMAGVQIAAVVMRAQAKQAENEKLRQQQRKRCRRDSQYAG